MDFDAKGRGMGTRYVLGLGGTVDYEIDWDPEVLSGLATEWGLTPDELDPWTAIGSERDLLRSLLGFVRDGVGGERFVASSEIVEAFARRFQRRITLGGTCVRAAIAMDRFGLPALVHLVSIDDHVRRLLPAGTSYLCSADRDTTDPHLIVQYPAGSAVRVGDVEVVAVRPNRLIYVNDPPNRELLLDPGLGDAMADADVVLVSGFNVIQEPETLHARLTTLAADLDRVPPQGFVYFEDAGYHVPALREPVRDVLAGRVDAWAMNEDELQAWIGRPVDLLDAADVAAAVRELGEVVPARTLVVHTQHWALAAPGGAGALAVSGGAGAAPVLGGAGAAPGGVGPEVVPGRAGAVAGRGALAGRQGTGAPGSLGRSGSRGASETGVRAADLRAALRGGITMAGTRYVHGDGFTVEDYAATAALKPGPLGVALAAALAEVAPEMVCEPAYALDVARPTTIGLGDTFVGGFLTALAES
jgi:sugar/nucleoside kinase (ribokinase family)